MCASSASGRSSRTRVTKADHRTHRKVLVADGSVGMTGGVGIASEWTGNAQDPDHWRDTHVRVRGPVVRALQGAFLENWLEATGELLAGDGYLPELDPITDGAPMQVVVSGPGSQPHEHRGDVLPRDRVGSAHDPADDRVLRSAADVRRGAARRRRPRGRCRDHRARTAHRQAGRAIGRSGGVRAPARRGDRHLRVPAHHAARQDARDRRSLVLDRLRQLRQPVVRAERRGDAVRPERARGAEAGGRVRGRPRSERTDRGVEMDAAFAGSSAPSRRPPR